MILVILGQKLPSDLIVVNIERIFCFIECSNLMLSSTPHAIYLIKVIYNINYDFKIRSYYLKYVLNGLIFQEIEENLYLCQSNSTEYGPCLEVDSHSTGQKCFRLQ
jgi:hypothetical protein